MGLASTIYSEFSTEATPPIHRDDFVSMQEADIYEQYPDVRSDREMIESYSFLEEGLVSQLTAIKDYGIRARPWEKEGQPYRNSEEMFEDVESGFIHFFTTENTVGESSLSGDHPMMKKVNVCGETMVLNDVFRIVHDIFGHAACRNSFGPSGEYWAWVDHRKTLSKHSYAALWSETRGQNVWTNFGPHMRRDGILIPKGDEDRIDISQRPYPQQKVVKAPLRYV